MLKYANMGGLIKFLGWSLGFIFHYSQNYEMLALQSE